MIESRTTMYCIKCGKKNLPEYKFCYNCGALLYQGDEQPAETPTENQPAMPPPPPFQPAPRPGRPPYPYVIPPVARRGEPQRFPAGPGGKPYIVADHPEAFYPYKNKDGKQVYASFAQLPARFWAVLIDTFVCYQPLSFLAGVLLVVFDPNMLVEVDTGNGTSRAGLPNWLSLLVMTLYLIYCIVLTWKFNGQTVGKKIMGIKVLRKNGQPMDFQSALRRNLFGYCLGLGIVFVQYGDLGQFIGLLLIMLVIVGFSAALITKERRGWHDWLGETLVVGQRELVEGVNY